MGSRDQKGGLTLVGGNFSHLESVQVEMVTPWKINMEPKNGGWEDDFPFQLGDF